jgi:hypothetical protein
VGHQARSGAEVRKMPEAADGERHEGLNLTPPAEGFELYRHKNAEETKTGGWSGLYWARRNEAGDYEIRAVTGDGEAYSVTGGVFPSRGFEEHYEKVGPPATRRADG